MSWPFAHLPDTLHREAPCSTCGRVSVLIVVYVDEIPGGVVTLCWPCLGRDGDPLHRLTAWRGH